MSKPSGIRGLILAMIAIPMLLFGQDFLPALNDNYMGINQAFLQPAAIADSRFRTDFNIGGFSSDFYNDAIHFRSRWLLYPTDMLTNENWWDENTYLSDPNGKDKNMFSSQSAIGPSFMTNLTSKDAIGFTSRVRSVLNIDDMDEPLFRLIYSNYKEQEYYNKWYFDSKMRSTQHIFGDYGLTYARIFQISEEHFIKGGTTLKLLQGIASSYIQTDDLYYYFNGQDYPQYKNISFNSSYIHAGLSDNWGDTNQYGNYTFSMNYQLTAKPSVGLDFGVVYEWRPKKIMYDYRAKGYDAIERHDKNKYFLKVGISVLDLGRLKYKKDYYSTDYIAAFTPDYQARYNNGDNSVPDNTYWMDANEVSYRFRDYTDFSKYIYDRASNGEGIVEAPDNEEEYTVRMPAAISLQADLNLFLEGLYVNITTYHALNQGSSQVPSSHYISTYSITPRYEDKWYGVSLPIVINQYGKVDVGLGGRAGVVYFGVNNLFSNVFKDTYGMHAYVGVKVPVPYQDPTKPKREKKNKEKIVYVPCCDCCRKDSGNIDRMQGLPGAIDIIADHSIININSYNQTGNTDISTTSESNPVVKDSVPPTPPPPPVPPEPCQPTIIHYEFNKSIINAENVEILDDFASCLLKDPTKKVRISGHTDYVGSDAYNLALSKQRAESAASYLISKGISPEQLVLEWYGESVPVDTNSTPEGRAKNRRVEIEMIE